jgi:hypothetical protein
VNRYGGDTPVSHAVAVHESVEDLLDERELLVSASTVGSDGYRRLA